MHLIQTILIQIETLLCNLCEHKATKMLISSLPYRLYMSELDIHVISENTKQLSSLCSPLT